MESCIAQDTPCIPLTTESLLNFIAYEFNLGSAAASLELYVAGIKFMALEQGFDIQVDWRRIALRKRGFRISSSNPEPQEPIRIPLLRQFGKLLLLDNSLGFHDFDTRMIWTSLLFAFFGFLRVSEYTGSFLRSHVTSEGDRLRLRLVSTKNSPNEESSAVLALSGDDLLCPIKSFAIFVRVRDQLFPASHPMFVFVNGDPYTAASVNSVINRLASAAGIPPGHRLSSHSLRIGAASEAARAGVNAKTIQVLGRWKSDCFLRYIRPEEKDMIEAQLRLLHV